MIIYKTCLIEHTIFYKLYWMVLIEWKLGMKLEIVHNDILAWEFNRPTFNSSWTYLGPCLNTGSQLVKANFEGPVLKQ